MDSSSTKIENMNDIRQSKNYADYLLTQGWIVERIDNINYFIKKIPFLGSILKLQRPETISKACLFEVEKLEKKYKVFQTIIEPNSTPVVNSFSDIHNLLSSNGYKLSKSPFLPSKTLHLDLTLSKEKIFRNFSKDCRYSIKKGEGIKISDCSTTQEITNFYNAWKKSVNFNRYVPSLESLEKLKKSFPQKHSLFLTSHNNVGSIIGGAIFTTSFHDVSNYIIYYWHGFTNSEGRTSLSQYPLLYQAILWGKEMKYKIFDFEGIYDERFPQQSWIGFTHFKKSFGGTEVSYPGCYIKYRLPV